MSDSFPNIEDGMAVLLRAEIATGIVLDEFNNRAIKPEQNEYTICQSTESALELAKNIVELNNGIECYIYNSKNEVKYKITIYDIEKF